MKENTIFLLIRYIYLKLIYEGEYFIFYYEYLFSFYESFIIMLNICILIL